MRSPFGEDHERYVKLGITLDLFKLHPLFKQTLKLAPEICSRISPLRETIENLADELNTLEIAFRAKCEFTIYLYDELRLMQRLSQYRKGLGENEYHKQFSKVLKKASDSLDDYYAVISFLDNRNDKNPKSTRDRGLTIWLFTQDITASAGYASFKSNRVSW